MTEPAHPNADEMLQVPPQVQIGDDTLTVQTAASPTIFPDHLNFITLRFVRDKEILAETLRVPRNDRSIGAALSAMAVKVHPQLAREAARRRKVRGF